MSKNPAWLDNAVFYEIYPQSFKDTNSDGIGDFQGIIEKLPYVKSTGCNAIWLNPCFESPFYDAGYDISDYMKTAPRYGTNDDLRRLFEEAHKLDMHVILDLVPGHTSFEHKWFKESMKAEENEFSHRYIWTDSIWEDPAGIENISGSIRGISDRNGSCAANFYTVQPALNYGFANPVKSWMQSVDDEAPKATRKAMMDVMRFWLSMGCDGFRIDMAGSLVKGDTDGSATVALWREFRDFLDRDFPEAVMISEWGQPDRSLMGGFHMDFLLHFGPSHYNDLFRVDEPFFSRRGKGDISEFVRTYEKNYALTDGRGLICIPSGNHDMARITQRLDDDEVKIAFAFLLTMPGAPFIYYGDEIGMRNLDGIKSVEGGFERTAARSPMQWDSSANAGFSNASPEKLYICIDPDENRPTAQKAMADSDSLYAEIQKLIRLRHEHEALNNNGKVEFLYAEKETYPLVYRRFTDNENIVAAINPSDSAVSVQLSVKGKAELIYAGGGSCTLTEGLLEMAPASAALFRIS